MAISSYFQLLQNFNYNLLITFRGSSFYHSSDCLCDASLTANHLAHIGREQKSLEIEGVKFFKQFVILKFKDIDNINDIEKYKGKSLYVTREHAVKLKKDEYFIADLIDMQVELEDGTAFGVLTDVMQTGANDVYCIRTEEHGEVLIPAIKDCILDVDVEAGKMKIHLLDGLI